MDSLKLARQHNKSNDIYEIKRDSHVTLITVTWHQCLISQQYSQSMTGSSHSLDKSDVANLTSVEAVSDDFLMLSCHSLSLKQHPTILEGQVTHRKLTQHGPYPAMYNVVY